MNRIILHCDLNNFFATVECMLDRGLRDCPIAVCGNTEERKGIVLAKNMIAKSYGVSTGEAIFQAKNKCADLRIVSPHYDKYVEISRRVRDIYAEYTNFVEPFGIDECWLDLTSASGGTYEGGMELAWRIKEEIKAKVGLTLSVGVSFNKIFAKLGSDLKKPDAVTRISKEEFREKIWGLPASDMMGVGRKTAIKLNRRMIRTIGDLARCPSDLLESWFGKCGLIMWIYANGLDESAVMNKDFQFPIKSVGHGMTTTEDMTDEQQVSDIFLELSQMIGMKLRSSSLAACGTSIALRDNALAVKEYQCRLPYNTQSASVIARSALELFHRSYDWHAPLRSVTVRAISLVPQGTPQQLNMFENTERRLKCDSLDRALDSLREKYGIHSVTQASYLKPDIKLVRGKPLSATPMQMYV
ncbi:MAG: DNA polymerase IV [Eubacteriales bacterium]